jgi:hypothetical protein
MESRAKCPAGSAFIRCPPERRALPRSLPDSSTCCRCFTSLGGTGFSARVRDFSPGGLGLELPRAVQPGQLLMARLANPGRRFATIKIARFVHAADLPPRAWRVGCVLENPFRDWEIASLSQSVAPD